MINDSSLLHSLVLNSRVTLPGNIFLAPMAGFTDAAFRHICTAGGSDMCYTEMVSCEALVRKSLKTKKILQRAENEEIYAVQIFCSNPQSAVQSLKEILPFNPLLIDLNCGCPVPKIIKSGSGSALMREPEKIGAIVKALSDSTDIPVTVKLRSGWDFNSINYLKAAEIAQKNGASMVALHPRTKTQGYSGTSDWSQIALLKKYSDIPVIGTGDIFTPQAGIEMLKQTGCDGIMIARGAVGRPEIFREIKNLASTGQTPQISIDKKIESAILHLELAYRYTGEKIAVKEIKKHLCAYIKGIKGSASVRNAIVHCNSREEYISVLRETAETIKPEDLTLTHFE